MAFLNESGLQRFWENIVSKFVRKVDGKDLSSNDYTDEDKTYIESLKEERLGTFTGKTIAELQAALETWLASNLVVNATTYVPANENSLINGWNSGDSSSTLSEGPRWFFTVMAVYTNTNYVNLRISSYNSENIYSVIRLNGVWHDIKKIAYSDNDIDIKDTDIKWSDKNIVQDVSPIDLAASNFHNANRFAFANVEGIIVEYSRDNGTTYVDYEAKYNQKTRLTSCIENASMGIGKGTTPITTQDKLRVSFVAGEMGVYAKLKKLLLNISTEGATGSNVIVEISTNGAPTTFTTLGTYDLAGWPGWNSIPFEKHFGGTASTYVHTLRLTFGITGLSSNTSASNILRFHGIYVIGGTAWNVPSTIAKNGHLYTYDLIQNATFPANVTATKFIGDGSQLTGI